MLVLITKYNYNNYYILLLNYFKKDIPRDSDAIVWVIDDYISSIGILPLVNFH